MKTRWKYEYDVISQPWHTNFHYTSDTHLRNDVVISWLALHLLYEAFQYHYNHTNCVILLFRNLFNVLHRYTTSYFVFETIKRNINRSCTKMLAINKYCKLLICKRFQHIIRFIHKSYMHWFFLVHTFLFCKT